MSFTLPDPASYRGLAELMYGDVAPLRAFLAGRRRHKNLLSGSLRFLAWGVTEPVRAASYAMRDRRGVKIEPVAEAAPILLAAEVAPIGLAPMAARAEPVQTLVQALQVVSSGLVGPEALAETVQAASAIAEIASLAAAPAAESAAATPALTPVPVFVPPQSETHPPLVRFEAPEVPAHPPLTHAAWTGAIAALADADDATTNERLDPVTWLAEIMALAGAERTEPSRLDLVHGPDFRTIAHQAPAQLAPIRSAA